MRHSTKTILLASAAAASLAVPALAESYFFRTKPLVDPPQAFSFTASTGQNPGATVESAAALVKGHRGKTATISGGEYQVCAAADCSGASWTSAPTANVPAAFHARVRVTAAPFGQTATARLAVGDASATFEVSTRARDTAPDAIEFAPVANVQPGIAAKSAAVAITGHDGVTLSVTNGGYQVCQTSACTEMDGKAVATETSGEVSSGTLVRLLATPSSFGDTATVTLRAGDTVGTFSATARGKDTTPAAFQFAAKLGQEPNQPSYSDPVTLSAFDGAPLSISGGGYQICTNADCSDQASKGFQTASQTEALPGTRIRLVATPPGFGLKATATLTVGAVSQSFEATARAKDETPDAISFASKADQAADSLVVSNISRLVRHDGVTVSVSGTGASYRVCADATCSTDPSFVTVAGTAGTDAYVQVRQKASATAGGDAVATFNYGTLSTTFSVKTSMPASGNCGSKTVRATGSTANQSIASAPNGTEICIGNAINPSSANFAIIQKSASGTYTFVGTESLSGGRRSVSPVPLTFQTNLYAPCSTLPPDIVASKSQFASAPSSYCNVEDGRNSTLYFIAPNSHDVLVANDGRITTASTGTEIVRY